MYFLVLRFMFHQSLFLRIQLTISQHWLSAKQATSHCLSQWWPMSHDNDVITTTMASQITSLTVVYSTVYSDADQRKYQSSASLAFVQGIHRGPVNSPHKWPVTRKMFAFDDVIMCFQTAWHNLVVLHSWVINGIYRSNHSNGGHWCRPYKMPS